MKSSNRKKGKIEYGQVELPPEAADLSLHKVRITTFIDGNVLLWLRESAAKSGEKYQTLLNKILRDAMGASTNTKKSVTLFHEKIKKKDLSESELALLKLIFGRVEKVVKEVKDATGKIERREARLEEKVAQIEKSLAKPGYRKVQE